MAADMVVAIGKIGVGQEGYYTDADQKPGRWGATGAMNVGGGEASRVPPAEPASGWRGRRAPYTASITYRSQRVKHLPGQHSSRRLREDRSST